MVASKAINFPICFATGFLRSNVLVSGAGHEISGNAPPSHRVRST